MRKGRGEAASPEGNSTGAVRRYRGLAMAFASPTLLIAAAALYGWRRGIWWLTSFTPTDGVHVAPNTAVGLILISSAILLLSVEPVSRWRRISGSSAALLAGLIGAATLLDYALHGAIGVDWPLVPEHLRRVGTSGKVSFNGAINLILIWLALLRIDRRSPSGWGLSDLIASLIGFSALAALAGYAYGTQPTFGVPGRIPYTGLALPSAIMYLLLSFSLLTLRPEEGLMATVTSRYAGGRTVRRLLLGALLIPLFGTLVMLGERGEMFDRAVADALIASMALVVSLVLILSTGRRLNVADEARQRALTELQTSREQLATSEAKYKGLLQSTHDALLVIDREGRIDFVNDQLMHWFGYERDELIGQPVELLIPDRFARRHVQHRANFMANPASRAMGTGLRLFGKRKDGSEFPVDISLSPFVDPADGKLVVTAIIRDVTDRQRSEDEQRFLTRLGQVLAESLDLGLTLQNLARRAVPLLADWCAVYVLEDGRPARSAIVHFDPAKQPFADALLDAASQGGFVSRDVRDVIDHRSPIMVRDVTREQLRATADSDEPVQLMLALGIQSYMIVPLVARDRTLGAISFVASSRNFSNREFVFAQEVANRAALSADNARLFEEAKRSIRIREQVLAIVSHDLKNPLNTVRLGSQLLQRQLLKDDSIRVETKESLLKTVEHMKLSGDRASRLIYDLLDFAKLDAGTMRVELRPESVRGILAESVEMMGPNAQERSISLRIARPENLVALCDRARVLQILGNLLGNSIKFSPEGSTVFLSAERAPGGMVQLAVRDQGPGMAPETVQHIFDRYWQPEETRNQGTGLGLAIARGLVEAQGGAIWVETRPGAGSTFRFTLHEVRPGEELDVSHAW